MRLITVLISTRAVIAVLALAVRIPSLPGQPYRVQANRVHSQQGEPENRERFPITRNLFLQQVGHRKETDLTDQRIKAAYLFGFCSLPRSWRVSLYTRSANRS